MFPVISSHTCWRVFSLDKASSHKAWQREQTSKQKASTFSLWYDTFNTTVTGIKSTWHSREHLLDTRVETMQGEDKVIGGSSSSSSSRQSNVNLQLGWEQGRSAKYLAAAVVDVHCGSFMYLGECPAWPQARSVCLNRCYYAKRKVLLSCILPSDMLLKISWSMKVVFLTASPLVCDPRAGAKA